MRARCNERGGRKWCPRRRLARALGGTLTIGARPDGARGTEFRLTLPLRLPPVADIAQLVTPVGAPLHLNLLIADDSEINRRIAARLAGDLGCTATLVDDGDAVPAAVARERFDAILMDIRMERVNGDVACAALRAAGFTAPVIAVTGNATAHDAAGYALVGFTATLGKPFGARELRATLERHVPRRT